MKGLKEITVSCALGLAILFTYTEVRNQNKTNVREEVKDSPVASYGPSEDPKLSFNWGLEQIHASAAWKRHKGSKNVVVAVIDTGCDIQHPELKHNIWTNPGESGLDQNGMPKGSNGIDDDNNGFVDDVHGWNFVSGTNDVYDDHGHGTHIAGIIGAQPLDGVSGVAPNVSLMILKYYGTESSGADNLKNTIRSIRYAVRMGADIINYSGGGIVRSSEEEDALKWAAAKGILVVAAAGNEGMNSDFYPFYPADYGLPNIISVAASGRDGNLLHISNYGRGSVHIAAPGKNILSTLPDGAQGYMSGTSQATAFVTGVAALLIANDPRFHDPRVLIAHLVKNSSPRQALRGKLRSGGLLNAELALDSSDFELTHQRVAAPGVASAAEPPPRSFVAGTGAD